MKRTVKFLYYRGVRQVANLIEKQTNKIQELSYRGATLMRNVKDTVKASTQPKMYRGVAY